MWDARAYQEFTHLQKFIAHVFLGKSWINLEVGWLQNVADVNHAMP